MNFLALTGFQAAILALVTSGVIVAFYFLKLRHRRVVIASSLLWKRVLDEREANSLWEKLRRLISILLAVTIGLLIALSVARPEARWLTGSTGRSIIVLDTSPTMLARRSDGRTRWQHATEAALALINSSAPSTEIRVADTSGLIDSGFTADRHQIRSLIERMKPSMGVGKFPVLDLDAKDIDVRLITDGVVPMALPGAVSMVSVFEEGQNIGITAFEIRSIPSSPLAYEAYLEVHNYGKHQKTVTVVISGAGRQQIAREVTLKPGEIYQGPFDLSRFEGGGIRATVQSTGDEFGLDDIAYAYLPVKRTTKTLLVTAGNRYLETLLKLHSLVDLSVVAPSAYRPEADFDVFIFDGFAPPAAPLRPALVIGNSQDVGWLPRATATAQKPKFSSWSEDHPVMQFVSLHDVSIDRAKRVDPTAVTVLAESENHTPLILASPAARRPRWVMVAFSLEGSDFPLHPGFPLFIDNTLTWFSREPLALRRQPGLVQVDIPGAQIKALDGKTIDAHAQANGTVFQADEPGLFVASNDEVRQYVAVNLASQQYSNINKTMIGKESTGTASSGWFHHELWFYMLCGAVVLITAEWFTYHRRITL